MASLHVAATDVREGDNYYLSPDTGVRVHHTVVDPDRVQIHVEAGLLTTVPVTATVRLHGRNIPA